ncbi:MAG: hypothetical protein AAF809_10520 [Bacteroidota bacterium]
MSRNLFTPPCGFDIADTTLESTLDVGRIKYWGHRVVRHDDGQHFIHQAFHDDREGLLGVARQPTFLCADDLDLLRIEIEDARQALDEPVLTTELIGRDTLSGLSGFTAWLRDLATRTGGDGAPGDEPPGVEGDDKDPAEN